MGGKHTQPCLKLEEPYEVSPGCAFNLRTMPKTLGGSLSSHVDMCSNLVLRLVSEQKVEWAEEAMIMARRVPDPSGLCGPFSWSLSW